MTPEDRATSIVEETGPPAGIGREFIVAFLRQRIAETIREAVSEEREACAKLITIANDEEGDLELLRNLAAAIRKRG